MSRSEPGSLPVPILTVQTLGRFRVCRGEEEIREGDWGREKARQLFQYFITNWQTLTARERITDDLWPELDGERADRDFKVALSAVNDALQPDRRPRSLAAYIIRQGTSYGLDSESPLVIDAVVFEDRLRKASRMEVEDPTLAKAIFESALSDYQGDYLPDALYEDWSSARREGLTASFLTGASRLARLLLNEKDTVQVILWAEKILSVDACWEEAYRMLMKAYLLDGNRPLAVRTYQRCRTALERELGIEPMAETTGLYERALADNYPSVTQS